MTKKLSKFVLIGIVVVLAQVLMRIGMSSLLASVDKSNDDRMLPCSSDWQTFTECTRSVRQDGTLFHVSFWSS